MTPGTIDTVEVLVHRDGTWWPGHLSHWRWTNRDTGQWRGIVTYTVGVGMTHYEAVDEQRIRRLGRTP